MGGAGGKNAEGHVITLSRQQRLEPPVANAATCKIALHQNACARYKAPSNPSMSGRKHSIAGSLLGFGDNSHAILRPHSKKRKPLSVTPPPNKEKKKRKEFWGFKKKKKKLRKKKERQKMRKKFSKSMAETGGAFMTIYIFF